MHQSISELFHMPHIHEDDGHSANTSDMKGGVFWLTFILDYKINDFGDVAGFVKGSVHVIDRNGSGELLGM